MAMLDTDVLVIGAGAAGLSAAEAARKAGVEVLVLSRGEGASPLFSGVNAPGAEFGDSPETFAADMIEGGGGINDPGLVASFTQRCALLGQRLMGLGVPLEGGEKGLSRRLLAGGSRPRGIYYRDTLGRETVKALRRRLREQNVRILSGMRLVDLWHDGEKVFGAYFWHDGQIVTVKAKATVLASGGIGSLYPFSTYPADVDGSGIAAAYLAGAELIDMEFIQFEPTVILGPPPLRGHLILTAMLGQGGLLLNASGERFMHRYDPERQERAHKDVLTRAILEEVRQGRHGPLGGVYFDGRGIDLAANYPEHYRLALEAGVDLERELIEVGPAAHSIMGGVRVSPSFETTLSGLFAAGEAAGGLHGASRLAGNGGADALVTGEVAGDAAAILAVQGIPGTPPEPVIPKLSKAPADAMGRIRQAVELGAPVMRDEASMKAALAGLASLKESVKGCPYEEMALGLGEVILQSALRRQESRGHHMRRDFPQKDPAWRVSQVVRFDGYGPRFSEIRR